MDVANLLLRIRGEDDGAKATLRELAAEMQKFKSEGGRAEIGVDGAEEGRAKIDALLAKLNEVDRGKFSADVQVNIEKARADLVKLRNELDKALSSPAGHSRPIENIFGDVSKIGEKVIGEVGSLGQKMTAFFSNLGENIGEVLSKGVTTGISAIISGLGSAISAGAGFAVQAALWAPLILIAVGVVGALAASLAGAVAGALALGTALVGALAPLAIVGVATFESISKILAANQQRTQNATPAARQQQAQQVQQSQFGVQTAQDNLVQSQAQLKQATTDAYRAWDDAVQKVKEDLLAVNDAQLNVTQSQIDYKRALLDLHNFVNEHGINQDFFKQFTDVNADYSKFQSVLKAHAPNLSASDSLQYEQFLLNVQKAKNGEKDATYKLHDANVTLDRDRQLANKYMREGIKANQGYVSALKAERAAVQSLVQARHALNQAKIGPNKLYDALAPSQKSIADGLAQVEDKFKSAFAGVVTPILQGVLHVAQAFVNLLKDPQVAKAFGGLAANIKIFFDAFAHSLGTPETRDAFVHLVNGASQLVRILGTQAFIHFFNLVLRIAKDALPPLLSGFDHFAKKLGIWDEHTSHGKKFKSLISTLVGDFKQWIGLIGALGGVLLAFFKDGHRHGESLVTTITRMLNKFKHFLESPKGRAKMDQFFSDTISAVRILWHALQTVADVLDWILRRIEDAAKNRGITGFLADVAGGVKSAGQVVVGTAESVAGGVTNNQGLASKGGAEVRKGASGFVRAGTKAVSNIVSPDNRPNPTPGDGGRWGGDVLPVAQADAKAQHYEQNPAEFARDAAAGKISDQVMAIIRLHDRNFPPGPNYKRIFQNAVRKSHGRAFGGLIPGWGGHGDDQLTPTEGGEYVVRRAAVQRMGVPFLDMINSGRIAAAGAGGSGMYIDKFNTEIKVAGGGNPDAEMAGAHLERVMRRRGRG